jgi:hypothetical protein
VAAEATSMHPYVVVSLLTGARTEEPSRLPQTKSEQGYCWWAILDLNQ